MRWLLAISSLVLGLSAWADSPRVMAAGETLEGFWTDRKETMAAFLGVPFAAPPVGELRWRAPQALEPREDVQQATAFAPACMQGPHITNWYAGVAEGFGYPPESVGSPNGVSEDCLYLNIWTPSPNPESKLPVMVWIHGGSNKGGWSYEPNYLGDRLAARGVVVVTVAYRLGPFGFFAHPALDNGPGEPVTNFGWLDADFALRWVQNNIQSFGGNPENVTVFGESSGAGNIGDNVVQNIVNDKLFKRVIIQSPGSFLRAKPTLAEAQAAGAEFIREIGIADAEQSMERIRDIPAQTLVDATYTSLPQGYYFNVVNDGLTYQRYPLDSFSAKQISRVDMLIGSNADEWYMYVDENADRAMLDAWLEEYGFGADGILRSLVSEEPSARHAIDRLRTARNTSCPSRYMAARISAAGGRAWVYYFSRVRPGADQLGSYHGTEIGYVFDQHEEWQPVDETDAELTDRVMDYWVQFARYGNPNLPDQPNWPLYTASQPLVMELGDKVGAAPPHDADLCLWLGPENWSRNGQ